MLFGFIERLLFTQ